MLQVAELAHSELEYISEREKLEVISGLVQACDFDPAHGVYTGIEGESFGKSGVLPHRRKTFGLSYDEYREFAQQTDDYGDSFYGYPPLYYALIPDVVAPAMVVYDSAELEESLHEASAWLPKSQDNVQDAARVVIKISGV